MTGTPAAAANTGAAKAVRAFSSVADDSLTMLQQDWVLREVLRRKQEEMVPVLPVPYMVLSFRAQNRYEFVQYNEFPNVVNGDTVVEQGAWELQGDKGLIGVQVAQLNASDQKHDAHPMASHPIKANAAGAPAARQTGRIPGVRAACEQTLRMQKVYMRRELQDRLKRIAYTALVPFLAYSQCKLSRPLPP